MAMLVRFALGMLVLRRSGRDDRPLARFSAASLKTGAVPASGRSR